MTGELGKSQCVWARRRSTRAGTSPSRHGYGPTLKRWHWQVAVYPRVPKIANRSSQEAWFAGTIE